MNRATEFAAGLYNNRLQSAPAIDFFRRRGLNEETIFNWRLGFAPNDSHHLKTAPVPETELRVAGLVRDNGNATFNNRVMFPIMDPNGEIVSFGGRTLSTNPDTPKYLNGPETPLYKKSEVLYGMDRIKDEFEIKDRYVSKNPLLLVEGYMDVLSMHQGGFRNILGGCGTSITTSQMKFICGLTTDVYLLYDGDLAGRRASIKSAESAIFEGIFPYIISLDEGQDPDDVMRTEGRDSILEKIEYRRKTFSEHTLESLPDKQDIGRRVKAMHYIMGIIAKCPIPLTRVNLIEDLCHTFDIAPNLVYSEIIKKME